MKKLLIIFMFCAGIGFSFALPAFAQDSITLSITPPLIKNNMNPGDIWKSTIKVVNNNPADLNIYVEAVDFRGKQEDGVVEFLPSIEKSTSTDGLSPFLSQWIVLEEDEIIIPAYGSKEIPFIIDVPENASPGGHYAAILAGTRPPAENLSGAEIKVSSLLASLVLLNVKGDVEERGIIREFSTDKVFYDKAQINFVVRFENLGNVHLQPLGEIKIYAPFNKLKNTITINHNSEFGNVLPQSIRKWDFSWTGEKNILEMGRYRADLVLGYGEEGRQVVDQKIYFWVIYIKPVLIVSGILVFLVSLMIFLIRLYIRRAIRNTADFKGVDLSLMDERKAVIKKTAVQKKLKPRTTKEDVIDLKK